MCQATLAKIEKNGKFDDLIFRVTYDFSQFFVNNNNNNL